MRLGGYVFVDRLNPESWVDKHIEKGFRSAVLPINYKSSKSEREDYRSIAKEKDILLAEVGAWSNPISKNEEEKKKAIEHMKQQLAFSDEMGARVCVNIAGSLSANWDGPHKDHYTEQTYEAIAKVVQEVIDDVKPKHTSFGLEMMPYTPPSDVTDYQRLIKMVDRDRFKVHFDPVNMINNAKRYYRSALVIEDFIDTLGSKIVNVHLKDILLMNDLTVHLKEVIPGDGELNYQRLLTKLNTLDDDLPVIIEHLPDEASYDKASEHIKKMAKSLHIQL